MPKAKKRQLVGMVYSMTNEEANNQVIAFRRGISGKLTRMKAYPTGGGGTGTAEVSPATPQDGVDPLASQGSLILSKDTEFLFAVNAGTNSISSFRVAAGGGLSLADVEPSGGCQPNSLAVFGNRLYVSNVGNAANNYASNISGFRVERDGRLTPISGATYTLSTANAQPANVVINSDGRILVVSELTTNRLSVFRVKSDGTLSGPVINESAGAGPFGMYFLSGGVLLVSESGSNALSSYTAAANGSLSTVSATIPNGQLATCRVAPTRNERYAFTSNAGSGTITIYRINNDKTLEVVVNVYSTAEGSGATPIDLGVSRDGRYLYVLNGNKGSISVFRIERDAHLTRIQVLRDSMLPVLGSQGLAVR